MPVETDVARVVSSTLDSVSRRSRGFRRVLVEELYPSSIAKLLLIERPCRVSGVVGVNEQVDDTSSSSEVPEGVSGDAVRERLLDENAFLHDFELATRKGITSDDISGEDQLSCRYASCIA
jgi:hypothetical protein